MPDQADVEQALAAWVAGALYPNGEAAHSAVMTPCRVYRGSPVVEALEADLRLNVAHVVVQPVKGSVKDTTRFSTEWQGNAPPCPLIAETDGQRVRFSGSAGPGMLAGVKVDGRAYAWRVTDGSTPGLVAAVLADMVRVDRPAALAGAGIEFAGGRGVSARAVSDGYGGQELRRQEMGFRLELWCPSPEVRDRLGAFVDVALSGLVFLDVRGWGCRVQYSGSQSADDGAAVRAWRRDLQYRIEYPTVLESVLPSMLFGVGTVNGAGYVG